MEKYSYCKELIDTYHIEELNSKTLIYRIDGFMEACNMNLENSICEKKISSFRTPYINKTNHEDGIEYSVNFMYIYDCDKGNNFTVIGNYEDLDFAFINYYDKDKNKNRIGEIPFSIMIEKKVNDSIYNIEMNSTLAKQVEFIIKKDDERLCFYANILDFSKILNLVNSFVTNPEIVFETYNEIMNKKKVVFTNGDLNKAIEEDERFEKPADKFVKKIKMITNSH